MGLKLAYIFDQPLPMRTAESEQLINTVSALSNLGYQVTLFIPGNRLKAAPTEAGLRDFYHVDGTFNVEVIYSVFPGPRLAEKVVHPILCATMFRTRLKEFDLVYTRNIPAIIAALSANVPCCYDTYRPWPSQYHHALVPLFRGLFHHPKFIGAALHSDYARSSYINFGFAPNQLVTAHNGYNPALFEPKLTQIQARKKLGLNIDAPLALYSGRMDPEKGIDSLIDLAENTPECQFIFIGSHGHGPLETRMDKLSNVHYMGWVASEDLTAYLYAADILMLPLTTLLLKKNVNSVLPIKLYSYFAAGRAIFASEAPDVVELLHDGVNACLVPQTDRQAAIEKFKDLVHSPELRDRLAAGAQKSSESCTWNARAAILDEFIRRRLEEIHST